MRYERLVFEAGENTFTLPLHPRLTVIAGVGELERESLIGEIVGALGPSRSGVHAELVQDDGRHIAVFRPTGGRHRVVDIETATDVSAEYADAQGRIDLLAKHHLDLRRARKAMRLAAADLVTDSHGEATARQLADCDQARLWAAADAVRSTDDELQRTAAEVGSSPEDADVVDRIEAHHNKLEQAQARHEDFRNRSLWISLGSTLIAIIALLVKTAVALPFLAITAATVLLAIIYRIRVETAARAEEQALEAAGAQSYLGFQIQRVNGLLSSEQHRRRLVAAAGAHRAAAAAWYQLAGDVPVDWALERREEIQAAAELRRDITSLGAMSTTAPELDDARTTGLAQALVARLGEARSLGATGEGFPLVLDEPFANLDPSLKPALLELLGHAAGTPQLVFLTSDEDVASWARLEALTGALAIVEPQPEAGASQAPPPRHARRRITT